jgi:nucleoside-diphosphate-sugar epimerase
MRRLIIWGAGELGSHVAKLWSGSPVVGLTESTRRHQELRALDVEPRVGSAASILQPDDVLLIALPGDALKAEAVGSLASLPPPRRAVLVSSTGFYGTKAGTLDETTEPATSARAQRIASLEEAFLSWAGGRGVVVRLGGLYCRGRGPMAALARRGTAKEKAPNRALPLIHYEDAARAINTALARASAEPVYLAVTPPCPTRLAFYEAACRRLDLPLPSFREPLPQGPASYDVSLMRRDLLPIPEYPDWRAVLDTVG